MADTQAGGGIRTHIRKRGNSLALHIPESLAAEAYLEQSSAVELSLVDGKLVVAPITEPAYDLDELLAGVTDENLHGEVDWSPAVGREAW